MTEEIVNSSDVDVYVNADDEGAFRLQAAEFTLEREQSMEPITDISAELPDGYLLGPVINQFEATITGFPDEFLSLVTDSAGRTRPFSMLVGKYRGGNADWEYGLETCVVENDETAMESGEAVAVEIEGYVRRVDKVV